MPRYYFHVVDGTGVARDDEGLDLPDLAAARDLAVCGARDIIASEVRLGSLDLSWKIEVADAAGESVLTVLFSEVVRLTTDHH